MKTTLTDIAERTGYSIATVSRVLNGKSGQYRISNEAYNSIMEEAKKSGYIGKMNAQSLRKSKTRSIGVIVPSIANPFLRRYLTLSSKKPHVMDILLSWL